MSVYLREAKYSPDTYRALALAYANEMRVSLDKHAGSPEVKAAVMDYLLDLPLDERDTSLIMYGEECVGFITTRPERHGSCLYLRVAELYIRPEFRRRGFGSEAVVELIGSSITMFVTGFHCKNAAANTFWRELAMRQNWTRIKPRASGSSTTDAYDVETRCYITREQHEISTSSF